MPYILYLQVWLDAQARKLRELCRCTEAPEEAVGHDESDVQGTFFGLSFAVGALVLWL